VGDGAFVFGWPKWANWADEDGIVGHNMVYFQSLFVLLHEYPHFCAGHLAECQARSGACPDLVVGSTEDLEPEADDIALGWCRKLADGFTMNGKRVAPGTGLELATLAITFLFGTFGVLETMHDRLGMPPDTAHPPAMLRWALICAKLLNDPLIASHVKEQQQVLQYFMRLL
jgi:hypothetical protein